MNKIQFIETTPEQLNEAIILGVKMELEKLKAEFQPKQPTEFLTRNEVKELLHIDLSTVHNWTKRGKLKAYGIAGRIYYKRGEIEQALQPLSN